MLEQALGEVDLEQARLLLQCTQDPELFKQHEAAICALASDGAHPEAFGALHANYDPMLARTARRRLRGTRLDGLESDAVQDVFVKAFVATQRDPESELQRPELSRAYFFGLLGNVVTDYFRSAEIRRTNTLGNAALWGDFNDENPTELSAAVREHLGFEVDFEGDAATLSTLRLARLCLDAAEPGLWELVVDMHFLGLTAEETGVKRGMNPHTVKTHIGRARRIIAAVRGRGLIQSPDDVANL